MKLAVVALVLSLFFALQSAFAGEASEETGLELLDVAPAAPVTPAADPEQEIGALVEEVNSAPEMLAEESPAEEAAAETVSAMLENAGTLDFDMSTIEMLADEAPQNKFSDVAKRR